MLLAFGVEPPSLDPEVAGEDAGAAAAGAAPSLLALPSSPPPDVPPLPDEPSDSEGFFPPRKSVTYQPLPFKMKAVRLSIFAKGPE